MGLILEDGLCYIDISKKGLKVRGKISDELAYSEEAIISTNLLSGNEVEIGDKYVFVLFHYLCKRYLRESKDTWKVFPPPPTPSTPVPPPQPQSNSSAHPFPVDYGPLLDSADSDLSNAIWWDKDGFQALYIARGVGGGLLSEWFIVHYFNLRICYDSYSHRRFHEKVNTRQQW